jgi:hypothetical protein
VLENQKRVLMQETFLTAIGRAAKAKAGTGSVKLIDGLPPFLSADNLKAFISDELRQSTNPVVFRTPKGNRAFGYDALLLPQELRRLTPRNESGRLKNHLHRSRLTADVGHPKLLQQHCLSSRIDEGQRYVGSIQKDG